MGSVGGYALLGPNSVTCTTSTVNGDVGTQAPSISNTGCTINGTIDLNLGPAVITDLNAAKGAIDGQTCTTTHTGTLAGVTLAPGVHCFTAGATLTGLLTLSGPANGIWIFRIGTGGPADLAATDFTVQMAGGGQACNVYWRSSQDATVTRGGFLGTILSGRDATVTGVGTYAGRVLATRDLTVTNVVPLDFAVCAGSTVTVTKISNGGVGTFNFTGSNGFAPQNITTLTPGTGVSGAPQTLTAAGVSTTITESAPPAGFTLTSITCSGLGAGGTATPDLGTRTVTLDAAATTTGESIECTFTNTFGVAPGLPTIRVTKVSNGGVDTFNFTGSNGFANQAITTVMPGVGVSGAPQTLTAAGVSTTITESVPPAGFTLTSIACSGLGAGGTATPNLGTRTVILDAAATAMGADIECTFTNTFGIAVNVNVPTLSEWGMILLAGLLALFGFVVVRSRARV